MYQQIIHLRFSSWKLVYTVADVNINKIDIDNINICLKLGSNTKCKINIKVNKNVTFKVISDSHSTTVMRMGK